MERPTKKPKLPRTDPIQELAEFWGGLVPRSILNENWKGLWSQFTCPRPRSKCLSSADLETLLQGAHVERSHDPDEATVNRAAAKSKQSLNSEGRISIFTQLIHLACRSFWLWDQLFSTSKHRSWGGRVDVQYKTNRVDRSRL